MLTSLKAELTQNDFLTIYFDGQDRDGIFKKVETIVAHLPVRGLVQMVEGNTVQERPEHALRNLYLESLPAGDFCLFADDDDKYVKGFGQVVRDVVSVDPEGLYFFRMFRHFMNDTIWAEPKLFLSNIGSPNGVVPCAATNHSRWGDGYFGDGEYYINLAERFLKHYFVDKVIYEVGDEKLVRLHVTV